MQSIHAVYKNNDQLKNQLIYNHDYSFDNMQCLQGFESVTLKFGELIFAGLKNINRSFMTIFIGHEKVNIIIKESSLNKKELIEVLNSRCFINEEAFLNFSLYPDTKFHNDYVGSYKITKYTEEKITITCSKDLCLILGLQTFTQVQKQEYNDKVENIVIEDDETHIVNCLCTVNHIRLV